MIPTLRRLAIAGVILIGATAGTWALNRGPNDSRIREAAAERIAALAESSDPQGGSVLVAGDSHAAALAGGRLCGEVPSNGGIGGVTTTGFAQAWRGMPERAHYDAIVLVLGTNDQQTRRHPERPRATRAAERAMVGLVADMQRRTDKLIVVAIPPNATAHRAMTQSEIPARNRWLARLCARTGCRYADPFVETRLGDSGSMKPGYARDGVHYDDYEPVREKLRRDVCPVSVMTQTPKT